MSSVPTVDIQSPHDPNTKWIINESDYDASKHVLWGERTQPQQETVAIPGDEADSTPAPVLDTHSHHIQSGMRPSVPDYIYNESGDIVAVNIINPQRRSERTQVSYEMYDPDAHQLWSMHPRFN